MLKVFSTGEKVCAQVCVDGWQERGASVLRLAETFVLWFLNNLQEFVAHLWPGLTWVIVYRVLIPC